VLVAESKRQFDVKGFNDSSLQQQTIRYDTIEEINVDSKAEYTA